MPQLPECEAGAELESPQQPQLAASWQIHSGEGGGLVSLDTFPKPAQLETGSISSLRSQPSNGSKDKHPGQLSDDRGPPSSPPKLRVTSPRVLESEEAVHLMSAGDAATGRMDDMGGFHRTDDVAISKTIIGDMSCRPSYQAAVGDPASCQPGESTAAELMRRSFHRMEKDLAASHTQVIEALAAQYGLDGWRSRAAGHNHFTARRQVTLTLEDGAVECSPSDVISMQSHGAPTGAFYPLQSQRSVQATRSHLPPMLGQMPSSSAFFCASESEAASFKLLPGWGEESCEKITRYEVSTVTTLKSTNDTCDMVGADSNTTSSWTLNPNSGTRLTWDLVSFALVMYDMVVIPLRLFPSSSKVFDVMEWVTRIFWTLDIPLTFCSKYVTKSGRIESNGRGIARRYLRSWFLLDFVIVGSDWIEEIVKIVLSDASQIVRLAKFSRVFRIVRMVRFIRLAKIGSNMSLMLEKFSSPMSRICLSILFYLLVMLVSGHILGCLWYHIGQEEEGWVTQSACHETSVLLCYTISFRWSLAQFGGGMDEFVPLALSEHIFAAFAIFIAFWISVAFISVLTSLMTQFWVEGSHHNIQLRTLRSYLEQNQISNHLVVRLTRNAKHIIRERKKLIHEEMVDLVSLVTEPLRIELHYEIYGPRLKTHPFFKLYSIACHNVVRRICHGAMSMMFVTGGDVVFDAGEIPVRPKVYFATSPSTVEYGMHQDEMELLPWGTWVAEAVLWVAWTHQGRFASIKDASLLSLDAHEFQTIASSFDYREFDPRVYAERFIAWLNEAEEFSDIFSVEEVERILDKPSARRRRMFVSDKHPGGSTYRGSVHASSPGAPRRPRTP